MGSCFSSEATGEAAEQKKRSQMIDRKLEEDSRQLRKECKILLLGTFLVSDRGSSFPPSFSWFMANARAG